jgi:hypothetical protein
MDKKTAELCDIVMKILAGASYPVMWGGPDTRPFISHADWKMIIDFLKWETLFIESRGDKYNVCLYPAGREFLEKGGSFVKWVEEQERESKGGKN